MEIQTLKIVCWIKSYKNYFPLKLQFFHDTQKFKYFCFDKILKKVFILEILKNNQVISFLTKIQ